MECHDETCPKHGSLKVRGAVLEGEVTSAKPKKTAVVVIQYARKVPKYERLEKRSSKIHVHVPSCMAVKPGQRVKIGECRKISKTKSFVLLEVL